MHCLYMSGCTADIIAHHGVLDTGIHFIQKPFSINGLARAIREILQDQKKNQPAMRPGIHPFFKRVP